MSREFGDLHTTANGPGLPRPIAADKHGTGRPIPWTNAPNNWGILHDGRAHACTNESRCLICGEIVDVGVILARSALAPALGVSQDGLTSWASDGGPLHAQCMSITVAHCRKVREQIRHGRAFIVPYMRDRPHTTFPVTHDVPLVPDTLIRK